MKIFMYVYVDIQLKHKHIYMLCNYMYYIHCLHVCVCIHIYTYIYIYECATLEKECFVNTCFLPLRFNNWEAEAMERPSEKWRKKGVHWESQLIATSHDLTLKGS